MELREMSESCEQQEKDVTLNSVPDEQASADEQVENAVTEDVSVQESNKEPEERSKNYGELDKAGLLELLTGLLEKPVDEVRESVAHVKQSFYAIRKAEVDKEREEFLKKGNEEAAFVAKDDELEAKLKELLNAYKEKRAVQLAAIEEKRKKALERKLEILEGMKAIIADPDNINKHYNKFQQLQQDFKNAGDVPAENVTELWKTYQLANENFYDLLKINKDLRDYDFKKNLEQKQILCITAEELDNETDIIAAFKKLQELHEQWREIGPVAKDLREELWLRFKEASAVINKKYQSFFEERKEKEKENENAKVVICEQVEAIDFSTLKNYSGWDEATKKVIALQEEWKTLGFASKKVNAALFARFRKGCDEFFAKKAEFYKNIKDEFASNLEKKIALCEKAEAMKDSKDWKKTTDEFIALQKEWKTIGPVVKKHSDAVWKRFITACDYFFEEKNKLTTNVRQVEHANLKAKKDIIAGINEILAGEPGEDAVTRVREYIKQWQGIGHVPFKEKDKIYAEYQAALNEAFAKFDIKESRSRISNFESNIEQIATDQDKLYRERERLVRFFEQKRNELKTYENNLGFFNATSKSGNSMLKEMERKMQKIREDIEEIEKKIEVIDNKL